MNEVEVASIPLQPIDIEFTSDEMTYISLQCEAICDARRKDNNFRIDDYEGDYQKVVMGQKGYAALQKFILGPKAIDIPIMKYAPKSPPLFGTKRIYTRTSDYIGVVELGCPAFQNWSNADFVVKSAITNWNSPNIELTGWTTPLIMRREGEIKKYKVQNLSLPELKLFAMRVLPFICKGAVKFKHINNNKPLQDWPQPQVNRYRYVR